MSGYDDSLDDFIHQDPLHEDDDYLEHLIQRFDPVDEPGEPPLYVDVSDRGEVEIEDWFIGSEYDQDRLAKEARDSAQHHRS